MRPNPGAKILIIDLIFFVSTIETIEIRNFSIIFRFYVEWLHLTNIDM